MLTASQAAELALRAADGDELAFAALCRDLGGMLHKQTADLYASGLERQDLVQEARIGLLKATRDWDAHTVPFVPFAAMGVRRHLFSVVKTALAGKHGPLNDGARFEQPVGADGRTLGEFVPFAGADPAAVVESRDELLRVLAHLAVTLSDTEATVLRRVLGGATLAEAGVGVGKGSVYGGSAKTADNALMRIRRKARQALAA